MCELVTFVDIEHVGYGPQAAQAAGVINEAVETFIELSPHHRELVLRVVRQLKAQEHAVEVLAGSFTVVADKANLFGASSSDVFYRAEQGG